MGRGGRNGRGGFGAEDRRRLPTRAASRSEASGKYLRRSSPSGFITPVSEVTMTYSGENSEGALVRRVVKQWEQKCPAFLVAVGTGVRQWTAPLCAR